jgi:hypothetical protein
MKTKIIAIMIISVIISCQKELNSNALINKADILGTWVNTSDNKDTIVVNDTIIKRWDILDNCLCDLYLYTIKKDSIFINYIGPIKVVILANPHWFYFNIIKDTLEIRKFHEVFGDGDFFKKIKNQ